MGHENLNPPGSYVINSIVIKMLDAILMVPAQRRTGHESRVHDCQVLGRVDFSRLRPERLPALHSLPAPEWCGGTVHGCPVRFALRDVHLRAPDPRGRAFAGEPLLAPGSGHPGAGDRQHSRLSPLACARWAAAPRPPCRPLGLGATSMS